MSNCLAHSPHELLESMVCGLPSAQREKWLLCMLTCFVDDSGSEPDSRPVFVLAGHISPVERWKQFTDDWDAALKSGPKQLQYFKMSEANSLKFQFLGWDEEARDAKLKELAKIIKDHVMFSIRAVLWRADLEYVQKQYAAYRIQPYELLFHHLMPRVVARVMGLGIEEKIDFVFDDQGDAGDQATASYRQAEEFIPQEMLEYVAGPPNHRCDRTFLPLQAADMLAWQVRRFCYENEHKGQAINEYVMRPTMKYLDEIPHETINLYKDPLEKFFSNLRSKFPQGL